jgi:integrase
VAVKLKHVQSFHDRHGHPRFYFRKPGHPRVTLPGKPGSPEFMLAYTQALSGEAVPVASRTVADKIADLKGGTVNAAVAGYFASAAFRAGSQETQKTRRSILEKFRRENGDNHLSSLSRKAVEKMVADRMDRPALARGFLSALRLLMQHAVREGMRLDDPTEGVKPPRASSGEGYRTWTEEDIARFEAFWPVGSMQKTALTVFLYTGQRCADVAKMGRQHIRNGLLNVTQQKTGAALAIPVHPELAKALDATPADRLVFLSTRKGQPFTARSLSTWFRDACKKAGLPAGCSAHGLRKAACRRLAEAGCSAHEIAAISGHKSLAEVARYTKAADQVRLAEAAIARIGTRP